MKRSYEQLFRDVEHVGSWWVRDGWSEYDVAGVGWRDRRGRPWP
jgi:hypothetical protein